MIETLLQNLVDQLDSWMAATGPFGPLLMATAILGSSLFIIQFIVE
jgi:hypothetical protein